MDLIAKSVTAIGALLAGVFIPIAIQYNQEKNRETQLYVQIMTQREQSDSALRSQMFNALISSYFGQEISRDPEKQMTYLHLLNLNFQEFFDARPLFEELNKRINKEQQARLLDIARDAADRQINLLTKPGSVPIDLAFCLDETDGCKAMQTFTLQGKKDVYPFAISLQNVGPYQARVRISSAGEDFNFKTTEFDVSYFDTPFMDNTKLLDGSRFSLVLRNVDPMRKMATVEVVVFPEEYMNLRDRPYFDEMLSRLGNKNNTENRK